MIGEAGSYSVQTAGYSKRLRLLIVTCARLAFFIYIFQVAAIDHWHLDPNAIGGVKGSALHASHCHAEQANCADSAGVTTSLTEISLIPIPPSAVLLPVATDAAQPEDAAIPSPTQPPRRA